MEDFIWNCLVSSEFLLQNFTISLHKPFRVLCITAVCASNITAHYHFLKTVITTDLIIVVLWFQGMIIIDRITLLIA